MEVNYSQNNTQVKNSYLLSTTKAIKEEVEEIVDYRKMTKRPVTRSINSYVREWRGHNRLYKWGIARNHTRDVDLNENNNIIEELLWLILGGV